MAIDVTRGATAAAAVYPILKLNEGKKVVPISKSAAFTLELTGGDYKTAIFMTNAGSASATVKFGSGNGIQGVGDGVTVTVAAGETMAICLDSGYFKNVSGAAKDAVTVTPSAAISFLIAELPQ